MGLAVAVAELEVEKPAAPHPVRVPIDHQHLARYTFGNVALEAEVLQLFVEQAPQYMGQLQVAETPKAWRDAAHTLKGSARAVGAWFVADAAQKAELLAASTDQGDRGIAIGALQATLDDVCRYIVSLRRSA